MINISRSGHSVLYLQSLASTYRFLPRMKQLIIATNYLKNKQPVAVTSLMLTYHNYWLALLPYNGTALIVRYNETLSKQSLCLM